MITIIPSILTNDPNELREKLTMLEGKVERVQIDIVDGVFVDNKTILPDILESIETNLLIDFHLMVKEPIDWVERCALGMADRIFGQVEHMNSQEEFVGRVQEVGAKVGLAIDLETPATTIDQILISSLDAVLVMAVPAGFGGQAFSGACLSKLRYFHEIRARDDTPFRLCIDGGINESSIIQVVPDVVDEVVVGNSLFNGPIEERIRQLQDAAYGKQ